MTHTPLVTKSQTLHEFSAPLQTQILDDCLNHVRQPKGKRYQKSFETNFFAFLGAFGADYLAGVDRDWRQDFAMALMTPQLGAWSVVGYLTGGLKGKKKDTVTTCVENALVYAIVSSYKFVIPPMYMRAKTELPGTHRASHSEREYMAYALATQPLLASFIRSRHKFWGDKIVAITGYLLNPELEGY